MKVLGTILLIILVALIAVSVSVVVLTWSVPLMLTAGVPLALGWEIATDIMVTIIMTGCIANSVMQIHATVGVFFIDEYEKESED